MKINQVEQAVGITKKNIRFYEDEGLLHPSRNSENGYREYSDSEIDILLKIKLLRKLSIPIGDIRRMQEHDLALSDCMQSHQAVLEKETENLALMKDMCGEIGLTGVTLDSLNAPEYLKKMQLLEEGGTQFTDIRKKDQRKKKYGPLTAAFVMILFMCILIALFIWLEHREPIPMILLLCLITIPLAIIAGVLLALRQRFQEIEKGEDHEASKY